MYLKALRASLGAKAAREAKGCFHVALGLFNFPTERAGEVAASRGAGSSAVTARREGGAVGRGIERTKDGGRGWTGGQKQGVATERSTRTKEHGNGPWAKG